MKETLVSLGLEIMLRDEAFYYLYEDGKLQGMLLPHVEDFTIVGKANFLEEVMNWI